MSAFIVSKRHIDFLVTALFKYEVVTHDDGTPGAIGQTLWQENHTSVNYRYDESEPCPPYTYSGSGLTDLVRDPLVTYKQIRCYVYQACEHTGYETSHVAEWMALLEYACERGANLPPGKTMRQLPGWDDAPWGIEEMDLIPTA